MAIYRNVILLGQTLEPPRAVEFPRDHHYYGDTIEQGICRYALDPV